MIRILQVLGGMLLGATLVACGGGGGSAGAVPNQPTPGPTTQVADFAMFTDKTAIANSGADSAKLTVVALDASRNVVSGAAVAVTVDQNAIFTPTSSTTAADGTYTGNITIGSDKTNREVKVTVTVNGITKQTSVSISGTKVTLEVSPSSPIPGQAAVLTATVTDSAGAPVSGATVALGGNLPGVSGQVLTTGSAGTATRNFTAPTTPAVYTISATSNGASAQEYQLTVFSNVVPAATIPAGAAPSLSVTPDVLSVNAPGSTANQATLKFLFLDAAGDPVKNVRVRFDDETPGLAAVGASISSGTTTLYTDSSGAVTAQYIAGQNSSATNGVRIKACYKATNFTSTSECPASVVATLTVSGQALAVSIGDDNLLSKGSGNVTYIKKFAITVADSAGRPVPNATVAISVDLTHYSKGQFASPWYDAGGTPTGDFGLTVVPTSLGAAHPSLTTDPNGTPVQRIWCPNEDTDRDGIVDSGENRNGSVDSNGQPTLEPRRSDLLISYDNPAVTKTDASGVLLIKVEYAQRFGTWLAYKIRATASVQGSQGMAERLFVTDVLASDVSNGSFNTPPYGVNNCNTAN